MKKILKILVVITVLLGSGTLMSCATIVRGAKSFVTFSSENGVVLDLVITDRNGVEVFTGQTPASVILKKQAGVFKPAIYTVEASRSGSADTLKIELKTLGDGRHFAWGAFLIGNIWNGYQGLLIDVLDGALYKWNFPRVTEGSGNISGTLEKREGTLLISSVDGVVTQ